jgi:hypothetical protein
MKTDMVFCYQNCSDSLSEKKCSSDKEKIWKLFRSLEKFIQTVKV